MFTQEQKDIQERLNALPKDDLNEIIASFNTLAKLRGFNTSRNVMNTT
jgi:hypothetical protein